MPSYSYQTDSAAFQLLPCNHLDQKKLHKRRGSRLERLQFLKLCILSSLFVNASNTLIIFTERPLDVRRVSGSFGYVQLISTQKRRNGIYEPGIRVQQHRELVSYALT